MNEHSEESRRQHKNDRHDYCDDVDVTTPILRDWLKADGPSGGNSSKKAHHFNIISYNILADCHTPEHVFPYCSRKHWKDVQRFPQLMRELDHHATDIICMQEVGGEFYKEHLEPTLRLKGYRGSYVEDKGNPSGVATFFKEKCFELLKEKKTHMSNILAEEIIRLDLKEVEMSSVKAGYSNKSLLVTNLRCRQSNKTLCLGNVHLSFLAYKRLDLIALEAALAIRYVTKEAGGTPYILCGDFNQEPFMPGYQVLSNGHLSDQDVECLRKFSLDSNKNGDKDACLVDLLPELFSHESKYLKSAYKTVAGHEVPFSNHEDFNGTMKFPTVPDYQTAASELSTVLSQDDAPPEKKVKRRRMYQTKPENYGKEVFIAALDYFWYGSDSLRCAGVLEMIDESKIEQFHSAPNIVFPSDHLLMKAEFEFL